MYHRPQNCRWSINAAKKVMVSGKKEDPLSTLMVELPRVYKASQLTTFVHIIKTLGYGITVWI